MAKATATDTDIGLINSDTITANGATDGVSVPHGRIIELAISVPSGVVGTIQCSFDAGSTWYTLLPTSASVVDATSAAQAVAMQYFTEEPGIMLRAAGAGTWGGGTLSFRVSGSPKR